jgi:LysM repeat protein
MTAAQMADTTLEKIQDLNPHLRKLTTPPNLPEFVLRIPPGTRGSFYRNYAKLPGTRQGGAIQIHTASRSETLEAAARRYGADPDLVREFNGMTGNPRLAAGQELVIPVGVRSPEHALAGVRVESVAPQTSPSGTARSRTVRPAAVQASVRTPSASRSPSSSGPLVRLAEPPGPAPASPAVQAPPRPAAPPPPVVTASSRTPAMAPSRPRTSSAGSGQVIHSISHVVRQGDTLSGVAGLYGVDMDRLRADNRITGNTLYVGQILTVSSNIPLQAQSRSTSRTTWVQETPGETLYHTVQRGETVGAIAERFRVTQAQLRELNNLSGNTIRTGQRLRVGTGPAPAGTASAAGLVEYRVQPGDTVSTVAERFGMKTADLMAANGLSGDVIRVGQAIRVRGQGSSSASPAPAASGTGTYEVRAGDTISQIAERHRITSAQLRDLNSLSGDGIRVGQKLRVSAAPQAAASAAPSPGPARTQGPAQASGTYEVRAGDTVSQIAERHGMRTAELRELNDLAGDSIRPGQRLRVAGGSPSPAASPAASPASGTASASRPGTPSSAPGTYEVRAGDTVSQIAESHGMRTAELRELNNLSGDSIRIGQRLRVTGGGYSPAPSAPSPPAASSRPAAPSAASASGTYVVEAGDTVSQIAERHGMRTAELRELNGLSGDAIRIGQRLSVSGGAAGGSGASPPPAPQRAAPQEPILQPGVIPLTASPSPARTGTPTASGSLVAGAGSGGPGASGGSGTYEVKAGDTVSQIAERHGMRSAELRELNGLTGDAIRIGQKLRVGGSARRTSSAGSGQARGSGTYRVQDGDSMYAIARRHGVTVDDIKRLNGRTGDIVRPGETLKIR